MPENRSCPADVGQSEDRRNEDDRKSARGIARRSSRHGRVNEPGSDTYILLNTDGDAASDGVIRVLGVHSIDASWFVL